MKLPQTDTAKTKRQHTLMIYGVLTAFFFIPISGFLWSSHLPDGLTKLLLSRLITWADLMVLYFYATKIERQRFLLWTEKWYHAEFYVKWLFLLFLLMLGCGMIARLPLLFGFRDQEAITHRVMTLVKSNTFGFAFTLITAGVTEELIFRGYILPRLERVIKNRHLPLIIASLMFAAAHYGYHNVGELIFTFCLAMVFGAHYQRYKSISILILMHALIDFVAISVHHPA